MTYNTDNPHVHTSIRRDGARLLIAVTMANAEKARKAMAILQETQDDGDIINIKFPNVTLEHDRGA